ncbi:GDSL esterase/lipase [Actinidia chinensis var. chinensis]|uniref:GDSL esterase/lipase n=1 Tax=Actinidia chinensis var. chinensis TaxID=1590841 RepID=A0A2R6QAE3_ACTCC|nr:GDSL esterase/lipase [Actinidia chinensis var. chinensis]
MGGEIRWFWVVFVVVLGCGVVEGEPQVPCYFIFGDSLVDNGNNNNIASLARANYLPYGIDFPNGPTGRFSNGKTTVDVIAELLGFDDYIPPYSSASGQDILRGVNYASAAAGIRDETGQQLGARISMNGQVNNYKNTVSQVVNLLGDEDQAANYLSQCIFSLGLGSLRVTNAGCCGVGRNNGQITCLPFQTPCQNRDEYLFWDAFHPGESANTIIGRRSYSAESATDAYPIDIRQLAQL